MKSSNNLFLQFIYFLFLLWFQSEAYGINRYSLIKNCGHISIENVYNRYTFNLKLWFYWSIIGVCWHSNGREKINGFGLISIDNEIKFVCGGFFLYLFLDESDDQRQERQQHNAKNQKKKKKKTENH